MYPKILVSDAIETDQPVAAGRLYERLSTSFPSAPEPKLGLAYMALHMGDFATADALFTEASTLATLPALKAEALLGAGRASLGREDLATAKTHFLAFLSSISPRCLSGCPKCRFSLVHIPQTLLGTNGRG